MKLVKASEIPKYRKLGAQKQKYKCAICEAPIVEKSALDHCHETGKIRGVLCTTCNRSEGKARKGYRYMAKKTHMVWDDEVEWLRALADYLEKHRDRPLTHVHPTFDITTGKQKPVKRRRKK